MTLPAETQVLVTGAGPVGQLAALSLVRRGVQVAVIDEQRRGSVHSHALALHPRSLELLERHGIADELLAAGQRVERMAFYRGPARVAAIDFSRLEAPFPFVLVVPQSSLERALHERLVASDVSVWWDHQAQEITQDQGGVGVRIGRREKYSTGFPKATTEWMVTKESRVRAAFLVGADGFHSFVRGSIGSSFDSRGSAEAFSVYDFPARIDAPDEARVVFHEGTTNVLWPLGERRGRFGFQVDPSAPPPPTVDSLKELIRTRAPWFDQRIEEVHWTHSALFERRRVDRFGRGRVWLAGDAAHLTGPVGSQSMNVGLLEADELATRVAAALSDDDPSVIEGYQDTRTEEWELLLGAAGELAVSGSPPVGLVESKDRIAACIPASGDDLRALLAQLGLALGGTG